MTIRKNSLMTFNNAPKKLVLLTLMVAGLAGCSSVNSMFEGNSVDYKSAGKVTTPNLAVPPDLAQLQSDSRFSVPAANTNGIATASSYSLAQSAKPDPDKQVAIAPNSEDGMH